MTDIQKRMLAVQRQMDCIDAMVNLPIANNRNIRMQAIESCCDNVLWRVARIKEIMALRGDMTDEQYNEATNLEYEAGFELHSLGIELTELYGD